MNIKEAQILTLEAKVRLKNYRKDQFELLQDIYKKIRKQCELGKDELKVVGNLNEWVEGKLSDQGYHISYVYRSGVGNGNTKTTIISWRDYDNS